MRISAEKWGKTIYQLLMSSKSSSSQGRSSTGATRNSNGNSGTTNRTQRTSATNGTQRTSATSTTATRQRAQAPQQTQASAQPYVQPQPAQHQQPQQTTYTRQHTQQVSPTCNTTTNVPKPELSLWGYFWECIDNYFKFEGRARRKEIWGFMVFAAVFYMILLFIVSLGWFSDKALLFYLLFLLIPQLAVNMRRLHDLGLSGWWLLVGIIPFIGFLGAIALLFVEGEKITNKYGTPPK